MNKASQWLVRNAPKEVCDEIFGYFDYALKEGLNPLKEIKDLLAKAGLSSDDPVETVRILLKKQEDIPEIARRAKKLSKMLQEVTQESLEKHGLSSLPYRTEPFEVQDAVKGSE